MMELSTTHLLDLSHTLAESNLKQFVYPWQALEGISDLILTLGAALPEEDYDHPSLASGFTKVPRWRPRPIWEHPASSGRRRRSATEPLSGVPLWWGQAVW